MKSSYGDRDTVGTQYLKAQDAHKNDAPMIVGDLTNELMKSFVDDLNACIESKPNGDKPFYITMHEKKDAWMKNAILRRVIPSGKRPFPEDDTVVFYTDPVKQETLFCWCLPHYVEMQNIIMNANLFDLDYVENIRAWLRLDLTRFGFMKDPIGNWIPDPNFKYHKMGEKANRTHVKLFL